MRNTIDRLTSVANPADRARYSWAEFGVWRLFTSVEDPEQIEEDFHNIRTAIELLENDYLGGGGTRGKRRVIFKDLEGRKTVIGDAQIPVPELN